MTMATTKKKESFDGIALASTLDWCQSMKRKWCQPIDDASLFHFSLSVDD